MPERRPTDNETVLQMINDMRNANPRMVGVAVIEFTNLADDTKNTLIKLSRNLDEEVRRGPGQYGLGITGVEEQGPVTLVKGLDFGRWLQEHGVELRTVGRSMAEIDPPGVGRTR